MEHKQIKTFIEKVKLESTYRKFVKSDIIYKLINIFNVDYEKKVYPKKIENPVEMVLQFYKDYNVQYYNIILEGIRNGKITISQDKGKSFTDTENNITFIRLYGNDGDLFLIVHELAHFIDRNSNPVIIPNEYWFLSEVFSFYMEKKLEFWLEYEKYKDLISVRSNNRMYYETKMLKAIESQLYYENLYREKGKIEASDINFEKIKPIMQYNVSNLVNSLLRYPLANILSDCLMYSHLIQRDDELVEKCKSIDLYEVLNDIKKYCSSLIIK